MTTTNDLLNNFTNNVGDLHMQINNMLDNNDKLRHDLKTTVEELEHTNRQNTTLRQNLEHVTRLSADLEQKLSQLLAENVKLHATCAALSRGATQAETAQAQDATVPFSQLTINDYFAAEAMAAIISTASGCQTYIANRDAEAVANGAMIQADAMMAARR